MPRLVSLLLMGTLIVVLGLTFFQVLAPFLMPLFLAGILAMMCQPIYRRILGWTKNRVSLAAGLTTLLILALLLVPTILGTMSAADQLDKLAQKKFGGRDLKVLMSSLRTNPTIQMMIHRYGQWTGNQVEFDSIEEEVDAWMRETSAALSKKTLGLAGSTLSLVGRAVGLVVGAMTFVIAFYYFLFDGPALIEATISLIPVHRDYQRQLIGQFDQAVRAVVSATFAAALGQGIATGIGMQIAGFHHFFIVTILATLTALVPVLGTWLVWGPYAWWLAYNDQWAAAIMLTLYGVVFVGLLDNMIRTYVLHSNVKLHPLLAFVSVLGGIQVLGLWGVFIGPIVASCLHALVRIFNTELQAFSLERQLPAAATVDRGASTEIMSASELKRRDLPPTEFAAPVTVPLSKSNSAPPAVSGPPKENKSDPAR
ncbi:MAG: AI-2E family transporter [Planctomycetales bacterium]